MIPIQNKGITDILSTGNSYSSDIGNTNIIGPMAYIGMRIKEARQIKGLSQAQLAEIVGISQPFLSEVERGQSDPSVENLSKFAVALEVAFEWLGTGRGERDYPTLRAAESPMSYDVVPEENQMIAAMGDALAIVASAMCELADNARVAKAVENSLRSERQSRASPLRDRLLARTMMIIELRGRRKPGGKGTAD